MMDKGEKRIRQEDCSEDNLGAGILTLTSKRIAFDKTNARIMDFSKRFGDTVLDIPLEKITKTWKEGLFMKKVCFTVKQNKMKKPTSLESLAPKAGLHQSMNKLMRINLSSPPLLNQVSRTG